MRHLVARLGGLAFTSILSLAPLAAQPPEGREPAREPGAPAAPGGPGGAAGREQAIKGKFDVNHDGVLDAAERAPARAFAKENRRQQGPGRGGRGGRGPGGPPDEQPTVDAPRAPSQISPRDVESFPEASLYDPGVIRTLFLTFPQPDWFEECVDFYRTDVEVPATMFVDGKEYADIGVGFRGNSSYFTVGGKKKSFALSLDLVRKDQRLYGYKSLNLLNAHADASFLREAIHACVARRFTAAFKANLVRLVVNGENWGVYANVQQFNNEFIDDEFGTRKGVRWKAPANFRGSGLAYLGDKRADYEACYQLKSSVDDEDAAWQHLIAMSKVLNETPLEQLESELPKVLDVDATLRFLALDAVVLDGDGYGSRGSDFVLWEGPDGRFRPLPYDSNEIMGSGGGGRGGARRGPPNQAPPDGAPPLVRPTTNEPASGDAPTPPPRPARPMGGASPTSSPLALEDGDRPLARLLKVSAWKARYLAYVRAMVREGLDWSVLSPFVENMRGKLDPLVRDDDKALYGHAAFVRSLDALKAVVESRTKAVLEHASMQGAWPSVESVDCQLVERDGRVSVQVHAKVTGAARATLWASDSRSQAFTPVPMLDDGANGDGQKGDGVFGASTAAWEKKGRGYVFVEAIGAGDDARVALSPSGGSGRPWVIELKAK